MSTHSVAGGLNEACPQCYSVAGGLYEASKRWVTNRPSGSSAFCRSALSSRPRGDLRSAQSYFFFPAFLLIKDIIPLILSETTLFLAKLKILVALLKLLRRLAIESFV